MDCCISSFITPRILRSVLFPADQSTLKFLHKGITWLWPTYSSLASSNQHKFAETLFWVQKPRRFGSASSSSSHCWVKTPWEGRERRQCKQTAVSNRLDWRLVHRNRWWLEIGDKFLTRLLFLRRAFPVSQSGPELVVSCHPLASALNSGTAK